MIVAHPVVVEAARHRASKSFHTRDHGGVSTYAMSRPHTAPPSFVSNRLMRVLLVLNGLGAGGVEQSTAELLPTLTAHGVDARVACLYTRAQGVERQVRQQGTPVEVLEGATLRAKTAHLRSIVRDWGPSLVHTALFEADLVGRVAAVGGPPVLSSIVNDAYSPLRTSDSRVKPWKLALARLTEATSGRLLTTHFHAISAWTKSVAVRRLGLPARRITVVPRSRDLDRLGTYSQERRSASRRRLGLTEHQPVIVTVGRQEHQKGHRHLVTAFERIVTRHDDAVLLCAGREGNETPALQAQVSRSAVGRPIRFLGHRDDIGDLLVAGDVFAFPSLYEGLGGAMIEACLLGVPAVASDLPPIREVVGCRPATVLTPPGRADELARGLLLLLDDLPGARSTAQSAVPRFARNFASAGVNRRMIQLYREVAAEHRRPVARRPQRSAS